MTAIRTIGVAGLLAAALTAGTLSDTAPAKTARSWGGYEVLAADFHVHNFPFGWATLSPWDTVVEAGRQGLDVFALTPHQQVWAAKVARWFSEWAGGPLVLVGEEMGSVPYHLIAVGIDEAISGDQPAANAIREVHAQGGIAIAAHPYPSYWPAYDADALRVLDGAEVVRPDSQQDEAFAAELRAFFGRAPLTAIGSSDYHGLGSIGYSRTYVFARHRTAKDVIDALRERRTVVYDRERAFGDPAMIELARANGGLPHDVPELPPPGAARRFSRYAALLALSVILLFNRFVSLEH